MSRRITLLTVLPLLLGQSVAAQVVSCVRDTPERRSDIGCFFVPSKRLPFPMPSPVLWHIDEFDSLAAAQRAETPWSVAVSAYGSAWLYTIEADTSQHHGGKHRAAIGPLPIEPNRIYGMVPMFAYFQPGQFTPVHTHPGPEAWWILEGEQCLQTTRTTLRLRAGHGGFVAEGDTMRLVATGKGPRRALALILHDPDKLPGSNLETPPVLKGCT